MPIIVGLHRDTIQRDGSGFQFRWSYPPTNPSVQIVPVDRVLMRQEQPWHPDSYVWNGVKLGAGANVEPPIIYELLTRQEQPWHPGSTVWAGEQQTATIAPPVINELLTRQEQPWHPPSSVLSGVKLGAGTNVEPPIIYELLLRQEQPWHPASYTLSQPPPTPKVPPFKPGILIFQETPFHPGSYTHAGTFPVDYEDRQIFIIL